ncbi:MAG TPA: CAP domain-containing protein, partial [Flexilinea sp.]|nr:CAP domain-containing protein [Flexilinea sp.]
MTASDLISLINGMRAANGLGALSVDSALMACAQNTALVMAQNNLSWHIGDVSGRVSQFGYNNGNKAFATENFMVGPTTLSAIQAAWSDYDHMIPATNTSYCHIGAGVAEVNGKVYYVVQAAYPAD